MPVCDTSEYRRCVRLASMMIAFLREQECDYDADLNQDILDYDGSGVPVENAVDAIIYHHLEPPREHHLAVRSNT